MKQEAAAAAKAVDSKRIKRPKKHCDIKDIQIVLFSSDKIIQITILYKVLVCLKKQNLIHSELE